MRIGAGLQLALAAALMGWPASAVERSAVSAPRTQSIAVFPDIAPGPPPKLAFPDPKKAMEPDPSLELLSTNPYEAELAAALARENLYGDDLANPYADEAHLANPYTDELRLSNPYSGRLRIARREVSDAALSNPYTPLLKSPSAGEAILENPYAVRERSAAPFVRSVPRTALPPTSPGTLAVETGPGFSGAEFVDGVGVPASGAALPVLPGSHTLTVYPAGGTPFTVSVEVRSGASQRIRLGR
jgi:hypothetical protein